MKMFAVSFEGCEIKFYIAVQRV